MFAGSLRRPSGLTVLRFMVLIDLVLLALLTLVGCKVNTPNPPTPPATKIRTVAVIAQTSSAQPIQNASVSITGTGFSKSGTTNADGYVAFNGVPDCPVAFTVSVTAEQFTPYNGLYGQSCGNADVHVGLASAAPPAPFVEPEVPLHPGSTMFLRPDGAPQPLRGVTAFLFMAHMRRGEDLGPQLDALYQSGFNELRVFGRVNSDPGAGWDEWADYKHPETDPNFSASLGQFFDLAAAHHLRVQYVPLTYPDRSDVQHAQLQTAYDVAAGRWNVCIEDANEPDAQGINVVAAHSGIDTHGMACWEYGTSDPKLTDPVNCVGTNLVGPASEDHSQRDPATWPMKAKNAKDLHDGWGKNDSQPCGSNNFTFAGTHVPQGENEPPGADETDQPGRRYTSVSDFQAYFGVCAFYAARCTFHTQDLIKGTVIVGSVQQSIAAGILQVWKLIGTHNDAPLHCQYTRGGLPDLPVVWNGDQDSLHTYATICGATAFVSDIRATRPTAGTNGWSVQDHAGPIYRLTR